jgi:hypothetical protein
MQFILDGIIGGIFISLFSYLIIKSEHNNKYEDYISIFGFLWAAPVIYLYMIYVLYINSNKNIKLLKSFLIHATIGTILSILFFIITILLIKKNIDINSIFIVNFVTIFFTIYLYLKYKLYKF